MRSHIFTHGCFLIPLLLLSGCNPSLQELKSISPAPDGFSGSLASEYLAYAESEAEQGRKSSSEHFAAKGLRATRGEEVNLDSVDEKTVGSESLSDYRAALMDVLNDKVKNAEPQKAARAQVLFDCWNEQEKEGLTVTAASPAIASCKQEFDLVYDEIREISDGFLYGDDSKNTIRFFEGDAQLGYEEKELIKKIASHAAKYQDYKLQLKTYRVDSGSGLSDQRLVVVRDELINNGVPKARIFLSKMNKEASDSAVRLSNDKEQKNRDVVYVFVTYKHNLLVELADD
ncbi:MAG: hypothetical protein AABY33_04955 [Pseudomonadota bacterium]